MIKKTENNSENKFMIASYSGEGVYLNTDENGVEEYVIIENNLLYIFLKSHFEKVRAALEEKKKEQSKINEDLFLKTIAILNGEKLKQVL